MLLFILLGASVASSNRAKLKDVKVNIDFGDGNFFIEESEIAEVVTDLGYLIDSTNMIDLEPGRIEFALENNAFIQSAEVYEQLNGVLHVDVNVREPVLRIYSQNGQSIYLDKYGKFMPLSPNYAARTPIANGYISINLQSLVGKDIGVLTDSLSHPDLEIIQELYTIVSVCRADEFWKAQFNQFYVNTNHEIEIIPRVGDHILLVGTAKDINKKLNKLRLFYDKGLNKTGWNEYKTINLKYANQVVCSKS